MISVASTDDRYATDIHYIGGALHGFRKQSWASTMLAYNARPPDPLFVGDRWREMWLERLDQTPPFLHAWVSHQRRDEFWKQARCARTTRTSRCRCTWSAAGRTATRTPSSASWRATAARARDCAARGGTLSAVGAAEARDRLPAGLTALLGSHAQGHRQRHARRTAAAAWIQEWVEPADAPHVERPGRWVAESAWPPVDRPEPTTLHLRADGSLAEDAGPVSELPFSGLQHTGLDAGAWTGWGFEGDDPPDQRAEDGRSLCFTSAPLPERTEMLGSRRRA